MKNKMGMFAGLTVLVGVGLVSAHLTAGTLMPKGGETVAVGTETSITWTVFNLHSGIHDISFSKDGGTTWSTIKKGLQVANPGPQSYKWTPTSNDVTTNGKIRVCQSGNAQSDPKCDTTSVSRPSGSTAPYSLVSTNFTVSGSTNIIQLKQNQNCLSLQIAPNSKAIEISFNLESNEKARLEAFDTQGKRVATLLEASFEAGHHSFSVFSNQLTPNAKLMVLKLEIGNQIKTLVWNSVQN